MAAKPKHRRRSPLGDGQSINQLGAVKIDKRILVLCPSHKSGYTVGADVADGREMIELPSGARLAPFAFLASSGTRFLAGQGSAPG
jgi:hypothetical protein